MAPVRHASYPKFLQNANFNLIAVSKFMQALYKNGQVQLPDGSKHALNFESQVAYNGIEVENNKFCTNKGDRRA